MEISFSNHALRQLQERKISKAEVRRTTDKPEKVIQQSPGRYYAIRSIRKGAKPYLLIVVYDEIYSRKEIVTAFVTSKIKKYL